MSYFSKKQLLVDRYPGEILKEVTTACAFLKGSHASSSVVCRGKDTQALARQIVHCPCYLERKVTETEVSSNRFFVVWFHFMFCGKEYFNSLSTGLTFRMSQEMEMEST